MNNQFKPETARMSFDVMQVPVISTAHITKEDGEQLMKADPRDVLATLYDSSGHIVHADLDEEMTEAFPPDRFSDAFRAVVQFFRDRGFTYLRLDAHASTAPDLPTFEW